MLSKRKILLSLCALLLAVTAVLLLPAVYITADPVKAEAIPTAYYVDGAGNRIDTQEDVQCAAYASAYVLRQLGEDVSGKEISPQIGRMFGFVSPNSVAQVFRKHGYEAKAYHGDIDTMKARLEEGDSVIVFLRIPGDTHYAVVTGFDQENIYLADSLPENANADGAAYNRIVGTAEFKELWKTGTILENNIYISVKEKR